MNKYPPCEPHNIRHKPETCFEMKLPIQVFADLQHRIDNPTLLDKLKSKLRRSR